MTNTQLVLELQLVWLTPDTKWNGIVISQRPRPATHLRYVSLFVFQFYRRCLFFWSRFRSLLLYALSEIKRQIKIVIMWALVIFQNEKIKIKRFQLKSDFAAKGSDIKSSSANCWTDVWEGHQTEDACAPLQLYLKHLGTKLSGVLHHERAMLSREPLTALAILMHSFDKSSVVACIHSIYQSAAALT